jgi:uncharacterized protein YjbJ (UPF0337 family)
MSEFMNKAEGRIKQAVGSLTGDETLKQEGAAQERKGQIDRAVVDVKGAAHDVKHAVHGAAHHVKHAVEGAVKDTKHAIKEVAK